MVTRKFENLSKKQAVRILKKVAKEDNKNGSFCGAFDWYGTIVCSMRPTLGLKNIWELEIASNYHSSEASLNDYLPKNRHI